MKNKRSHFFVKVIARFLFVLLVAALVWTSSNFKVNALEEYKVLLWIVDDPDASSSYSHLEQYKAIIKNHYESLDGITVTDKVYSSGTLKEEEISDVQLIFIIAAKASVNKQDGKYVLDSSDMINNYLNSGGRVVLNGEYKGFAEVGNNLLNKLAEKIGGNFTITTTTSGNKKVFLNTTEKSELVKDIVADNFIPTDYAIITSNNPDAVWVMRDVSNNILVLDQEVSNGYITVITDINWANKNIGGNAFNYQDYSIAQNVANRQFLKNLLFHSAKNMEKYVHDLTYSVDGATITATCSLDNCILTDKKATLSVIAPTSNLVYDGTEKVATLSDYDSSIFAPEDIKYYKDNKEVTKCVDAGTYSAKVTSNEKTAEVSFTITKANPVVDNVADKDATYNQTLSEILLPNGWSWNQPTDKVGDVGTRQHKATYTPEDSDNYSTIEQDVNVIVAKANPLYTIPTGLTVLAGKTLADVKLPSGWSWNQPTTSVGEVSTTKTFKATFTPEDLENYNIVENIDVAVKVIAHEHSFTYTANGQTINAKCGNENCPITSGLSLILVGPVGSLVYDGNAKAATLEAGYDIEAFPNPEIKYFKNNTEVTNCVDAGTYTAKITYGNATAEVTFIINNWTISKPDKGVDVEIVGAKEDTTIEVLVEVKTDLASSQTENDYTKALAAKLENNEKVAFVYDVKLIKIINVDGVETRTEIQPENIKPGTIIVIKMNIPTKLQGNNFKLLHIHSADDMEFIENYEVSADKLSVSVRVNRLSEFAFIITSASDSNNDDTINDGSARHGFCIGWILFILALLDLLYLAFYAILWFPQCDKIEEKWKLDSMKKYLKKTLFFDFLNILLFIGLAYSLFLFIFGLIVVIVHGCVISIISFILVILILCAFGFLLFLSEKDIEIEEKQEKVEEDGEK